MQHPPHFIGANDRTLTPTLENYNQPPVLEVKFYSSVWFVADEISLPESAMWGKSTDSNDLRARTFLSTDWKRWISNKAKWDNWTHISTTDCTYLSESSASFDERWGFFFWSFRIYTSLRIASPDEPIQRIHQSLDNSSRPMEDFILCIWDLIQPLKWGSWDLQSC